MGKLLVVGSLNMDTVVRVENMPKPGETILGKEICYVPGGKGANQAYAMGKLGADVAMIGCVGKDENGQILIENLKSVCVDTAAIQVIEKEPTGIAFITVEKTGQNSIIVLSGANFSLTEQWIMQQQKYIEDCDVVIAQLEIPLQSVCRAVELAKQKGKMVILDPAPALGKLPKVLLQNVTLLKPNETELQALTGMPTNTEQEIVLAANTLLKQGVDCCHIGRKRSCAGYKRRLSVISCKKGKGCGYHSGRGYFYGSIGTEIVRKRFHRGGCFICHDSLLSCCDQKRSAKLCAKL